MRFLVVIFVLILGPPSLQAQETDSTEYSGSLEHNDQESDEGATIISPSTLKSTQDYKAEELEVRRFDAGEWKEIIGSTDYEEEEEEELAEPANLPERSAPWGGAVLRLVSYFVIVALALLIIYYVMRNAGVDSRPARVVTGVNDFTAPVEDIEAFDMDALLKEAAQSGNFRLIVRIYYVGLLKKLNTAGIITWKKDKTNLDYLSELFSKNSFYEEVKGLTRAYEIVWYGERTLTAVQLDRLISDFENIHSRLNAPGTS